MSQIKIFLYRPSGQEFEVPVMPSRIAITDGTSNTRKVVLGAGPVGFPGYRNTKKVQWESFFPYHYDSSYCNTANLLHPQAAVDFFIKSITGTKVLGAPDIMHLKITDQYEDGLVWPIIDDFFTIEEFQSPLEAAELTDVHYSISLETITIPSLRVVDATAEVVPTQLRKPIPGPSGSRGNGGLGGGGGNQTTYTVQSGDSLSGIAGKLLGDMGRWSEIYDLNKNTIGSDPDLIFVGQTLTIPGTSSGSSSSGSSGKNS